MIDNLIIIREKSHLIRQHNNTSEIIQIYEDNNKKFFYVQIKGEMVTIHKILEKEVY